MKKGMLLSLMMVVLVALASTSFAVAPIIQELPTVIVGDSEDVATGGLQLMRYLNAFNIASKITRSNGYDLNKLHVFYTGDGTVKPSTTARIVQPLDAGEITALGTGTLPAVQKEITNTAGSGTASDFYWMSLINDTINAEAATPATDAYSATALANGVNPANYPAGSTDAKTLTVYAVDGDDNPTTPSLVADGDFVVYSTPGATDAWSGGVEEVFSASGAALATAFGLNSNGGVTPGTSADGLTLSAGSGTGNGYWQTGTAGNPAIVVPVTEGGVAGKIFRAQAVLGSTAATVDVSPQTRLFAFSRQYHHNVGIILKALTNGTETGDLGNIPTVGNDKTAEMYWAAPMETTQMSDAGVLANAQTIRPAFPVNDVRGYCLEWRVMDNDAADAAVLTLKSFTVTSIGRPADVTPTLAWGAGNTDFDDATAGFGGTTSPPPGITNPGVATITAASAAISPGTGADGYASIAPGPAGAGALDLATGQLVRMTIHASTSVANATPNLNMMLFPYKFTDGIIDGAHRVNGNLTQFNIVGSVGLASLGSVKAYMMAADGVPPCNPKVAADGGSTIETYMFTGGFAPTVDVTRVIPQAVVNMRTNRYGGTAYTGASDYPKENATITIDSVTIEGNVL